MNAVALSIVSVTEQVPVADVGVDESRRAEVDVAADVDEAAERVLRVAQLDRHGQARGARVEVEVVPGLGPDEREAREPGDHLRLDLAVDGDDQVTTGDCDEHLVHTRRET